MKTISITYDERNASVVKFIEALALLDGVSLNSHPAEHSSAIEQSLAEAQRGETTQWQSAQELFEAMGI